MRLIHGPHGYLLRIFCVRAAHLPTNRVAGHGSEESDATNQASGKRKRDNTSNSSPMKKRK